MTALPHAPPAGHPPSPSTKPRRSTVGVFSKRKGVRYRQDGAVLTCRFCEILRQRDEPFLYEDEHVVIFRPLRPIVASHVLIVPRAHIRNVTMLEASHEPLLRRMRLVAERVLLNMSPLPVEAAIPAVNPPCPSADDPLAPEDSKRSEFSHCTDDEDSCSPKNSNNCSSNDIAITDGSNNSTPSALRLSFHVPPFNSIDHVHMHAFHDAPRRMGVFGRLKYKTESWWCRSYDDVLARLSNSEAVGCKLENQETAHLSFEPVGQDVTSVC